MEADWEFEIGGDAPIIDAHWSGFVDLRAAPERAWDLSECSSLRQLAAALIRLNGADSPVWTSKTDVFTPEHIDADEMGASAGDATHSFGCYIDLLPRSVGTWNQHTEIESFCRDLSANLRAVHLMCCRVDLVARRAVVADGVGVGLTAYITACGSTSADAKTRLGECLGLLTDVIVCWKSVS